jgi:hypothetical protein
MQCEQWLALANTAYRESASVDVEILDSRRHLGPSSHSAQKAA